MFKQLQICQKIRIFHSCSEIFSKALFCHTTTRARSRYFLKRSTNLITNTAKIWAMLLSICSLFSGARAMRGNSATPERIQKADRPAVLLVKSRTPHKSFLFLLEEKNRRAQIKKCKENFFAGWRGFRATAGLASLLGVLLKKGSNFVQ